MEAEGKILITGASGYVGGRLKVALAEMGRSLRLLVRSSAFVSERQEDGIEYEVGDARDKRVLMRALTGIESAYYFIHSMGSTGDFSVEDRELAAHFARIASKCGVKKIIYLGALGSHCEELSPHLKSRQEVGEILRANSEGVQVIEFRASIVLGSGSLSFEMVKALTEKLPVMITPKWVWTEAQPIAIDDLLQYLVKSLTLELSGNPIFEIGGKDRVSYGGLMVEYARQKKLKRFLIPVPVLSPKLSSLWLGLVTPLYARVGRKLIESATCTTVVHDPLAMHLFGIHPMGYREAIALALKNEGKEAPETRWNESRSSSVSQSEWSKNSLGGRLLDHRERIVPFSPEKAFIPIESIGGAHGYYCCNWLWRLRGILDLFVGGVGFRRGRRDPHHLKAGEVVDFWRVEEIRAPHFLRLRAEMKVPGKAWLEFYVEPHSEGSKITQRAVFEPSGFLGMAYWYLLYPLHHFVFKGLLRGIEKRIAS